MILVTGGTGFIGGELCQQLSMIGQPYKLLIQPGIDSQYFPRHVDIPVAICSLTDVRGLRAVLQDVDTVYHLSSIERSGAQGLLGEVDVKGIEALCEAAQIAKVKRLFYLSHLGADRASAFYLMKAKGIAETIIKNSGLSYTILRSSMVYGEGDQFTLNLASLLKISKGLVLVPGDGSVLLQPLWVKDLATALAWSLELPDTIDRVLEVGGPEHISFLDILKTISKTIKLKRFFVEIEPSRLGFLTQIIENMVKGFPTSSFWTDYLATDHICALDSMSRTFGINPARFHLQLDYLKPKK